MRDHLISERPGSSEASWALLSSQSRHEIHQLTESANQLVTTLLQKRKANQSGDFDWVLVDYLQQSIGHLVVLVQHQDHHWLLQNASDASMALRYIQLRSAWLQVSIDRIQHYLLLDDHPQQAAELLFQHQIQPLLQECLPGVAVQLDCPASCRVRLPLSHFEVIWRELLNNARLYARPDRELQLQIRIQALSGTSRLQVQLADNGLGIDSEQRQRVFDPLVRLRPDPVSYPGTGMGLALVRKVLALHQCHIQVEASSLGGACLMFELPVPASDRW